MMGKAQKGNKKRKTELGVHEAALKLGVSKRSVINYIREKKVKAVKVGRKYFIDMASLEAFAKDTGLRPSKEKEMPAKDNSILKLASYRLCLVFLKRPLSQYMQKEALKKPDFAKMNEIKFMILESLGGGFYSFGKQKLYHYQVARSHVGAMLGILYSDPAYMKKWRADISFLEAELLPAITSIVKMQERNISAR